MGVIKKKTITRGTEGGVKYICDVCSADITNTVSAFIASPRLCACGLRVEQTLLDSFITLLKGT